MAENERHAAWQKERSFAITLLPEQGEPTALADGLSDLLDAVDLATEWLEREDPKREGTTGVAIFETREGVSKKVWDYPPERREDRRGLAETFGFDPVTWVPAGRQFKAERRLPRPPPSRSPAPLPPVAERAPDPPPASDSEAQRPSLPLLARAAWDDVVSRGCLIAVALSLWLALTLMEIRVLALLLPALTGLWWRRRARAAASARAVSEDVL